MRPGQCREGPWAAGPGGHPKDGAVPLPQQPEAGWHREPVLLLLPAPWLQGPPSTQPALRGPRALSRTSFPEGKAGLTPPPPHPHRQRASTVSDAWALTDGAGDAEERRGHGKAGGPEGASAPARGWPAPGRGQRAEAPPAAAGRPGQPRGCTQGQGVSGGSHAAQPTWRRAHSPEGRGGPLPHRPMRRPGPRRQWGLPGSHRKAQAGVEPGLGALWAPPGLLPRPRRSGHTAEGACAEQSRSGRSVGSAGSGRPVGKSRGCSCVCGGHLPSHRWPDPYLHTRTWQEGQGRE